MHLHGKDGIQVMFMMGAPVVEGDGYRCKDATWGEVRSAEIVDLEIDGVVVDSGTMLRLTAQPGSFIRVTKASVPPEFEITQEDIKAARDSVTVTVVDQDQYDGGQFEFGARHTDGSLLAVIDSLLSIQRSVPKKYRDAARCEISSRSSYDSALAYIEVSYSRPETDDEVRLRLEQAAIKKRRDTRREMDEYDRLQRKFGR